MNLIASGRLASVFLEKPFFIFLAVLAAALLMRLYAIDTYTLWLDEAYSHWFATRDWSYLWHEAPQFETHPPLYYSILKIWISFFGDSEFAMRTLSVVPSLASITLIYVCGRWIGGREHGAFIGLLAALFMAFAAPDIYHAQNARPYTFLVLVMAIAFTSALWLVLNPDEAKKPLWKLKSVSGKTVTAYAGLAAGLALLHWFHNLGGLYTISFALFFLYWWLFVHKADKTLFLNLLLCACAAISLYLPFLEQFFYQLSHVRGGFWLKAPNLWDFILQTASLFYVPFLTIPLAVAGLWALSRKSEKTPERFSLPLLLFCTSILPYLINVIITYSVQPIFLVRTLLPCQFGWFLLLASAPLIFQGKGRVSLLCFVAPLLISGGLAYHAFPEKKYHSETVWKTLVTIIAESAHKNAPVLLIPNANELPAGYYARQMQTELNLWPLPGSYPLIDDSRTYPVGGRGVPDITREDVASLMTALEGQESVWLLRRSSSIDGEHLVRKALIRKYGDFESVFLHGHIHLMLFDSSDE